MILALMFSFTGAALILIVADAFVKSVDINRLKSKNNKDNENKQ